MSTKNKWTLKLEHQPVVAGRLRLEAHWTYIKAPPEDAQQAPDSIVLSKHYRTTIHPRDLICKRVFKGSLTAGGRFYANAQRLTPAERKTIRIDNQPTVELDIKSLSPRILYNLKGLEAPTDCYDIPEQPREVVKKALLVMLNSDSEKATCLSLRHKHQIPIAQSRAVIAKLKEIHQPIAEHFFKSSWKELQYEDSCLTESILLAAMRESIPVLPIHDSYITITKYQQRLTDIINQCYRQRYGFDCVVTLEA